MLATGDHGQDSTVGYLQCRHSSDDQMRGEVKQQHKVRQLIPHYPNIRHQALHFGIPLALNDTRELTMFSPLFGNPTAAAKCIPWLIVY